jgi:hypothetical protein
VVDILRSGVKCRVIGSSLGEITTLLTGPQWRKYVVIEQDHPIPCTLMPLHMAATIFMTQSGDASAEADRRGPLIWDFQSQILWDKTFSVLHTVHSLNYFCCNNRKWTNTYLK